MARVNESVRLRQTRAWDKDFGGYVQALDRDLTVKDFAKSKHSYYGYTSSLLINLFLVTRSPATLQFAEALIDLTTERMNDPEYGWVRGFPTALDRNWDYRPAIAEGKEIVAVGAQLTAALAYLRLCETTGGAEDRAPGERLARQLLKHACDPESGSWADQIGEAALPSAERHSRDPTLRFASGRPLSATLGGHNQRPALARL